MSESFRPAAGSILKSFLDHSPVRGAISLARSETRLRKLAFQLRNYDVIELKDRNAGFFSLFFQSMGALEVCRLNRQELRLLYDQGPYYDSARSPESWWEQYFGSFKYRDDRTRTGSKTLALSDSKMLERITYAGAKLPRGQAFRVAQTFSPVPQIEDAIDSYAKKNFRGRFVIGIHYRGTDKVSGPLRECNRVDYDLFFAVLERIQSLPFDLFVATDEASFLHSVQQLLPGRVFSTESTRSVDNLPIHQGGSSTSPFQLGAEALIDATLLSRSQFLIRCDSNLSLASLVLSKELPSENLTEWCESSDFNQKQISKAIATRVHHYIARHCRNL